MEQSGRPEIGDASSRPWVSEPQSSGSEAVSDTGRGLRSLTDPEGRTTPARVNITSSNDGTLHSILIQSDTPISILGLTYLLEGVIENVRAEANGQGNSEPGTPA